MDIEEKIEKVAEAGASYQTPTANQPVVREAKAKNGKKIIKITGQYQQAEGVRQDYLDAGAKVGLLNKDRFNESEYYFFLEEEPSSQEKLAKSQVAVAKEDIKVSKRKDKEQLIRELKGFRLMKAREEKIAAYLIFNNEEMEALISAYPANEEELMKVKGFGKKKVEKYGEGILRVFSI